MARKNKGPRRRIAVIEEGADNIYSMRFVLESLGYEARSLAAQENFLTPLVKFAPELVLVDMMIPAGGGYRVIRSLQASDLKRVPILAITADAMEGEEKDIYEAGGRDILAKPYSITQLKRKLEKLLA